MSRLNAAKLLTTPVTDREAAVLRSILGAEAEQRHAYGIHAITSEIFKDTLNGINLQTVRNILKKYHELGVITVDSEPTRSNMGPAKYLVSMDYPKVAEMLISQRCLEHTKLLHAINQSFAEMEINEKSQASAT